MKHLSDFNDHPSKCLECGSTKSPKHMYREFFECENCGEKAHYKYFQIGVGEQ